MTNTGIQIAAGQHTALQTKERSALVAAVIENFAPRFFPGSLVLHARTGEQDAGYFDQASLDALGIEVVAEDETPDVVFHDVHRHWLILVDCTVDRGPINNRRLTELVRKFSASNAGLVYVTAFTTREEMSRHLDEIAWGTEVWIADAPSHLIHFNGKRFSGPYTTNNA
jgi:hypothetical protein